MALRGEISDSVSISLIGGQRLFSGIERWAELVEDFSPAWPFVVDLVRNHYKRTFDSEGAGVGGGPKWAALSPGYAAYKRRRYPGRPLLVATTALRSAMVGGGSGSLVQSRKKRLDIGLRGRNLKIGNFHQTGTDNMPARPPVKYDKAYKDGTLPYTIGQILQLQIVAARKKALRGSETSGRQVGDPFDDKAITRRLGSMRRLSKRKTR